MGAGNTFGDANEPGRHDSVAIKRDSDGRSPENGPRPLAKNSDRTRTCNRRPDPIANPNESSSSHPVKAQGKPAGLQRTLQSADNERAVMSIKQLRAFHYVALAGGFSQAARELATSQSTLSSQVGQLEASSGISLFERKPKGAIVTPEGEVLFELTTRLFSAETEVRNFLRAEAENAGGHLRVAADGPYLPLPIMERMRKARPRLRFALSIDNSDRVIDSLLSYRADVGITARRLDDPRLHAHHFLDMNLGLCLMPDHPLAKCRSVAMKELAGLDFVMREKGSLTREVFERSLHEHDVKLGSNMEISTREGVREAVAAGFGVGVVADREFGHDNRLVFVPLADCRHVISEYAVCLAERRHLPLVRAFFREIPTAESS